MLDTGCRSITRISELLFGDEIEVIQETNFQLILLTSGCGALGTALISPILDSLIDSFGVSPADIGLMMSAYMAPIIIMVPLAGILSDRYGRKPILTIGLLIFGIGGIAIAFTTDFRVALGLRVIQGVGFAGTIPIGIASLGDLYDGEKAAIAHGFRMSGSGIFQAVFPIIAGVLVVFAWQFPFFLFALCIPTALSLHLLMDEPIDADVRAKSLASNGKGVEKKTHLRELLELISRRHVLPMVGAYTVFPIIWFGFLTYNSVVVVQLLDGTPTQAGVLAGLASICYAASGTQAGQLTSFFDSQRYVLISANIAMGVGLAVFALAPTLIVAAVGVVVLGSGFGLVGSLYRNIITNLAPPSLRGGLVSFSESTFWVMSTLTPIGMGATIAVGTQMIGFVSAVQASVLAAAGVGAGLGIICLLLLSEELSEDGA